jgi:hypothetical protein
MSDLNYFHIMGFVSEKDLDADRSTHIDSIAEEGDYEAAVKSIIEDNKGKYYHVSVESDNGREISGT